MKKSVFLMFFIIIFIFSFIIVMSDIQADTKTITGEIITGKTTSQQVSLNISVIGSPLLSIITPKNLTYLVNESLLLSYSSDGASAIWYNLDNSNNITITSSIYFNTSEGSHILYLYANNGYGNVTLRNVTFFTNSSRFIIIDDKFDDGNINDTLHRNIKKAKKGDSTDFLNYSYEEIQNLTNIILHNPNYVKILFNLPINLTDDENPSDNLLDINSKINVSTNRIELNSTALPNFNKTATLWLYNLTFSNPRILRDGSVCPSSICIKESYIGGILKFNVTDFSVYSAEETPVEAEAPSTEAEVSGGGGSVENFVVDKEKIEIKLKQGQTKKDDITIKNTGSQKISINFETELEDFIIIKDKSIEIEPGKSKTVSLDFIAREDSVPNLYIGKIIINGEYIKKEILVSIEIESKKSLFDVNIEIPEKFRKAFPGDKITANIKIYNVGYEKEIITKIGYIIKNEDDETVFSDYETLPIDTEAIFKKEFKLPSDLKEGIYFLYVKIIYEGEVSGASTTFSITPLIEKPFSKSEYLVTIIVTIILIILIFILGLIYKLRKLKISIVPMIKKPFSKKIYK